MALLVWIGIVVVFVVLLGLWFIRAKPPVGVKLLHPHYPVIGMLPALLPHVENFAPWVHEECVRNGGQVWGGAVPGQTFITVTTPESVEYILKTNFYNFVKGERFLEGFEELLGRGIFTVDGKEWKTQRKVASHLFKTRNLRNIMEDVFVRHGQTFVNVLEEKAKTGEVFDIQQLFARFTFDTICEIGFGYAPNCITQGEVPMMKSFDRAQTLMVYRFLNGPLVWKPQRLLSLGPEGQLRGEIKVINEVIEGMVNRRLKKIQDGEELTGHEDFLTLFINRELEQGNKVPSPKYLRDIVASFIIAGRDTTASTLTSSVKWLAQHPEVEEKLVKEINEELMPTKNDLPSYDLLMKKGGKYLDAVINEVLRLDPPVPVDSKSAVESCVLPDGTPVGAGTVVFYLPFHMGRNETLWGKDSESFRPERWFNLEKEPTQYQNPVFNAGPRICLGMHMANFEAKLLTCLLWKNFKVKLVPDQDFTYMGGAVVLYKNGLKVSVERRAD